MNFKRFHLRRMLLTAGLLAGMLAWGLPVSSQEESETSSTPTPLPVSPEDSSPKPPDDGILIPEVTPAGTPAPTSTPRPTEAPTSPTAPEFRLDSPTPTPSPSPSPTPIAFLPPLCLQDSLDLIERSLNIIPEVDSQSLDSDRLEGLLRMIQSSYNYLRFRDDLHTSLVNYRWIPLDDHRVDHQPGYTDRDVIKLNPPVEKISAISFEAREGDIYLYYVQVIDEKGRKRTNFDFHKNPPPRLIRHSLPRREIFHLWSRTTISEIIIECQRANPNVDAEVAVLGGITDQKEYAKTALHRLAQATEFIKTGDWTDARRVLNEATEYIVDYEESRSRQQ